ncbi:hypothetical protein H6764_00685 [Candidatus Nomurabacteria bacterium]|nr:hypothetical protein [Candidatus Nomurabacteria bacterium]
MSQLSLNLSLGGSPEGSQVPATGDQRLFNAIVARNHPDILPTDPTYLVLPIAITEKMSESQTYLAADLFDEYGVFNPTELNTIRQSDGRIIRQTVAAYFFNHCSLDAHAASEMIFNNWQQARETTGVASQVDAYARRTQPEIQGDLNYYMIISLLTLNPTAPFELISTAIQTYPWLREGTALSDMNTRMQATMDLFRSLLDEESLNVWRATVQDQINSWDFESDDPTASDKMKELIKEMLLGKPEVEAKSEDAVIDPDSNNVEVTVPDNKFADLKTLVEAYSQAEVAPPHPEGLPSLDFTQIAYLELTQRLITENPIHSSSEVAQIAVVQAMLSALVEGDSRLLQKLPMRLSPSDPSLSKFTLDVIVPIRGAWLDFVDDHPEFSSEGQQFNIYSTVPGAPELFDQFVAQVRERLPVLLGIEGVESGDGDTDSVGEGSGSQTIYSQGLR